jgi:hypothetical protein
MRLYIIIFITGSAQKEIERRDNRHARVISCRAEPVRDLIEIGRKEERGPPFLLPPSPIEYSNTAGARHPSAHQPIDIVSNMRIPAKEKKENKKQKASKGIDIVC